MSDPMNPEVSPPFHDYWLKGSSQADLESTLQDAGVALGPTHVSSYDPVGTIWRDTGEVDPEGNPVMAPLDGWHANLRMTLPLSEEQLEVLLPVLIPAPGNPARVWA